MSDGAAGRVTLPGKHMAVWQSINKQCNRLNGSLEASKRSSHTLGSGVQKSLADIGRTLDKIHGALETANDSLLQMQKRKPPTVTAVMKVDALQSQMAAQVQYMKSIASALGVTAQAAQVAKAEAEKARKVEWWKGFKEKAAAKKDESKKEAAKKDESKGKEAKESKDSDSKKENKNKGQGKSKSENVKKVPVHKSLGSSQESLTLMEKFNAYLMKDMLRPVFNAVGAKPIKKPTAKGKMQEPLSLMEKFNAYLMKDMLMPIFKSVGAKPIKKPAAKGKMQEPLSLMEKFNAFLMKDMLMPIFKSVGAKPIKKSAAKSNIQKPLSLMEKFNAYLMKDMLMPVFNAVGAKPIKKKNQAKVDKQKKSALNAKNMIDQADQTEGKEEKKVKEKKPRRESKIGNFLKTANIVKPFNTIKSLGERAVKKAAKPEDIANWNKLNANVDASFGQMGEKAMVALRPILDTLNNAFASGRFDGFINGMSNGFMVIATVLSELINGILFIADAVQQNWDIVGPILAAIAFVLLAAAISQIYTMAIAWLAANWPILLIIGIIAVLIYVLSQCGTTMSEVAGYIGAAFGWASAYIQNVLIGLYNNFLSFSDFIRNLSVDLGYAFKKLGYDLAMTFLNFIYQMALGVENFAGGFMQKMAKAINWVIEKVNQLINAFGDIFGLDKMQSIKLSLIDETDPHYLTGMIDKARNKLKEPTSDKDVFNSAKKEMIDPTARMEEFKNKAINMTNKFSEKVSDISNYLPKADKKDTVAGAASGATNNGWMNSNSNANTNINHVNSVGSINKEVDISSDDLKMMRELAEIQAIQNFVELTPTVQVTTGNINNAGDIESIITKIGQKLNEEFVSTAQGVYT